MRISALFLPLALFLASCGGPSRPDLLEIGADIAPLIDAFDGRAGVYIKDLVTGQELAINADTLYPTASMIKVPIMVAVFDRLERGELAYQQELVYTDSLFYSDDDLTGEFRDSATVLLSEMVMLSISKSDNTASLWLQELAGTGVAINEWLANHGFVGTRMNSRTPGRRVDWETYGWGQTTPREMARLMEMIATGQAVSPAASEEMLRVLQRPYWDDEALSQIPPAIEVASKNGAVSASKSEVLLVHAPSGPYLFCVITADQADTRWAADNAGYVLIRDISRLLWNTFEPDSPYAAAPGSERYRGSDE
ncbi:MAG: class A beta-lactamase-related serine hydrolase [Bacteroidetes bacterium]|nr:class A beta-lactamase-related serine hydrolase [Bacteroidota bacterium]MDA0873518.1 class A beta-lactamase-related serine hydrolase [Bacteroidota bacterium]